MKNEQNERAVFELENRYIVIKRKDLRESQQNNRAIGFSGDLGENHKHPTEVAIENVARKSREKARKPYLTCLVIESDWPEYPIVLQMLKDRVEHKTAAVKDPLRLLINSAMDKFEIGYLAGSERCPILSWENYNYYTDWQINHAFKSFLAGYRAAQRSL